MKNKYLILSIVLMSLAKSGYTDESILLKNIFKTEKNEEASEYIQYHNRVMLFMPGHIGYERIKPNGMYAGVEAFVSPIFNKRKENLVEGELRLGHNYFYNGRDHFTPFVMLGCAGVNHARSFLNIDYRPKDWAIAYGGVGFLYTHEFDSIFNLGANVKVLVGGPVRQKHKKLGSPVIGTDIAIPFTFRFGKGRHWDFRIEPFFFGLTAQKTSVGYFGWRNSIGYRF